MEVKKILREQIQSAWQDLDDSTRDALRMEALASVATLEVFKKAQHVWCYAPDNRYEIDFTTSLMEAFPDKQYAFPRVVGTDLEFCQVSDFSALRAGFLGILEPIGERSDSDPDLILVPGLAFDVQGFRLGRGGGFYDRFLADQTAFTLGVVPDWALVHSIPTEDHDQAVDLVLPIQHRVSK